MKLYTITAAQLTPEIREAINRNEEGKFLVYGIFIYESSVSISRLHKGSFADIQLMSADPKQDNQELGIGIESELETYYLFPVPEYVVEQSDQNFARFMQIHIVREAELKDSKYCSEANPEGYIPDDVLMKTFSEAFISKLAEVSEELTDNNPNPDFNEPSDELKSQTPAEVSTDSGSGSDSCSSSSSDCSSSSSCD